MTKYQLAKLISLANGINSRKRVQKIICLLQAAGMKWNVSYRLHHYGPYSQEVADMLDEMTSCGILDQEECPNSVGIQFNYHVAKHADSALRKLEQEPTEVISEQKQEFDDYKKKIDGLLKEKLSLLELDSTIVHCFGQVNDWDEAEQKACNFKGVEPGRKFSLAALELAKNIVD